MTDSELATLIQSESPADRKVLEQWLAMLPPHEAIEKIRTARETVYRGTELFFANFLLIFGLLFPWIPISRVYAESGYLQNSSLKHIVGRKKIAFDILLARYGCEDGRDALLSAFISQRFRNYLPQDGSAEEALAHAFTLTATRNKPITNEQQKQLRFLLQHLLKAERGQDISEARADLAIGICRLLLTTLHSSNKRAVERVARQTFAEPNRRAVAETVALLLNSRPKIRNECGEPFSKASVTQEASNKE